jgi:hypothetical protein
MNITEITKIRKYVRLPKVYYVIILLYGFISLIFTIVVKNCSNLDIQNKEYLIETFAGVTVQIFINLMALIGIFVVFRLQLHINEEAHLQSNSFIPISNQNAEENLDQAYSRLPVDMLIENMALERAKEEINSLRNSRLMEFKRKSHYLLSFMATIFIFSYIFLSFYLMTSYLIGSRILVEVRFFFGVFVTMLCVSTFFMIFRFVSCTIQDQG